MSGLSTFTVPQLSKIREIIHAANLAFNPQQKAVLASMLMANIAHLSKGYSKGDLTEATSAIFLEALQVAIESLHALPAFENIRSKVMMLVHRMVTILGDAVLPCVSSLLEPLVRNCEDDVTQVVQLMNLLLIKFGKKLEAGIDGVVLPFLRHCVELTPQEGAADQMNVEKVRRVRRVRRERSRVDRVRVAR